MLIAMKSLNSIATIATSCRYDQRDYVTVAYQFELSLLVGHLVTAVCPSSSRCRTQNALRVCCRMRLQSRRTRNPTVLSSLASIMRSRRTAREPTMLPIVYINVPFAAFTPRVLAALFSSFALPHSSLHLVPCYEIVHLLHDAGLSSPCACQGMRLSFLQGLPCAPLQASCHFFPIRISCSSFLSSGSNRNL